MHKLSRGVRFSVNPFLGGDCGGFNSFASKPAGEGLSIFFELCVEITGPVAAASGFVVNVTDIDSQVREFVVPIFAERVRRDFRRGEHIGLLGISELLRLGWGQLSDKFGAAEISMLTLSLNPFRKAAIDCEGSEMIYFSEKFEFAATHKLWNEEFSAERNLEVFGKCANPAGHGHNYVVEVTVKAPAEKESLKVGDFERVVNDELIEPLDHKNLNVEVEEFSKTNPTVENIAVFAWKRVVGKFGLARLHCVTVWETDKTYCSYFGSEGQGD